MIKVALILFLLGQDGSIEGMATGAFHDMAQCEVSLKLELGKAEAAGQKVVGYCLEPSAK